MLRLNHPAELQPGRQPVAAALGIFDGVHLGHQALLRAAAQEARAQSGISLAITFDRHPNSVVAPEIVPPMICTLSHRLELIAALGLDATLVLPFTPEFSRIPAEDFVHYLVRELGGLQSLSVGQRFSFGHRRGGNVDLLSRLGTGLGFQLHALPPVMCDGRIISSTWIRESVSRSRFDLAGQLLGRPYSVKGRVIEGDRLGRTLGFPTANLEIAGLLTPPPGVYAAQASYGSTRSAAVVNVGHRPTLRQPQPSLRFEVHLLDDSPDLYGQELEVDRLHRLRDERRFESIDELRAQIARDIDAARGLQPRP